jgi:hypothetical protein
MKINLKNVDSSLKESIRLNHDFACNMLIDLLSDPEYDGKNMKEDIEWFFTGEQLSRFILIDTNIVKTKEATKQKATESIENFKGTNEELKFHTQKIYKNTVEKIKYICLLKEKYEKFQYDSIKYKEQNECIKTTGIEKLNQFLNKENFANINKIEASKDKSFEG